MSDEHKPAALHFEADAIIKLIREIDLQTVPLRWRVEGFVLPTYQQNGVSTLSGKEIKRKTVQKVYKHYVHRHSCAHPIKTQKGTTEQDRTPQYYDFITLVHAACLHMPDNGSVLI